MTSIKNFKTVDQLGKELEARQARKVDAVIDFNRLRYIPGAMTVKDDDGIVRAFHPTKTGYAQILRTAEIPSDFFMEKMNDNERQGIFNRLASLNTGKRMLRMDGEKIYGCVGENYKIIDNLAVLDVVKTSSTPMVLLNGSSQYYDTSKFVFTPAHYINSVDKGSHIPAVTVINSENGLASFRVACSIFTLVCTNGMIISLPHSETFKGRFYHKGNKSITFPNLNVVLNFAETMVVKMEKAEKTYMSMDQKVAVINRALSQGISHETLDGVINVANNHYRNGRCLSDICGSFTQYAQRFVDDETNKRIALEEFAGQLLQRAA